MRSLSTAITKDTKTSFICDDKGCYDYAQWAKSLNSQENLDKLISSLKQLTASKLPTVCVFNLVENKCSGPAPKTWAIYPLAPITPAFTFRGFEFVETKVTASGGISFQAKPIAYRGDTRLDCLSSDGNMSFSLDSINFEVSRNTCFNFFVPGSAKNTFQVLFVDLNKKEIIAKWDQSLISYMTIGGGSAIVKMAY